MTEVIFHLGKPPVSSRSRTPNPPNNHGKAPGGFIPLLIPKPPHSRSSKSPSLPKLRPKVRGKNQIQGDSLS